MELLSSRPRTHVGSEAQQSHLFKHQQQCINIGGLFLICTHSSHRISLSTAQKRVSSLLHRKGSLSHTWNQKLLKLKLQLEIQTLTNVDHQTSSSDLCCRFIWTSSKGCNFWWWNQVDLTDGLRDIDCPSLKEVADAEATTADPNFD